MPAQVQRAPAAPQFGLALGTDAVKADELVGLAELADTLGLELLGIIDHPYTGTNLDAWTLLTAVAARTERIRVFPDVANLPFRPPVMLARAAASLDLLSGGRVELGLGSGVLATRGSGGAGAPRRTPGEAVAALAEAIEVIRLVWGEPEQPVSFEGEHYSVEGVAAGPAPAHPIGIWVGAYGPRSLEVVGRLGDGWLPSYPYVDPAGLTERNKRIDEAAVAAGRSPGDVRRLYNIVGHIDPKGGEPFHEGVAGWTERLTSLVIDHGVSGIQLALFEPGLDYAWQVETFAQEVVPAVREAVEKEWGKQSR
ncbi:LLM class flavin-dependent oxidoreductase [Streptomyces sp. NPDC093109]|uniref:LLM class flavin-dependent oxidoreductase n=1 Tax=Streptomyces sp. NPDC093109 TaxID=3154977 RepID=UPI00344D758D